MRILLSAYSCRPNAGSELGVGWRWAVELAGLGHEVCLLTREFFRPFIESHLSASPVKNLTVAFYDPPAWLAGWYRPGASTIYLHYYIWQIGALGFARRLVADRTFDVVHHITFGVFRQPSLLYFLPVPFVFGPVGGGESTPSPLRRGYPLRGKASDFLRDVANRLANLDPFLRLLYRRSRLILCKTEDTWNVIPLRFRNKAAVKREIGIDLDSRPMASRLPGRRSGPLRVLFVGRLIYWKGAHLALQAFGRLLEQYPNAELTLVGSGKEEKWLRQLVHTLGIDARVQWISRMDHAELLAKYAEFDVFLFPSLHDSSGNVVLEAMSAGLPVICLDLGGPPTMVDERCGIVVPARHGKQEEVVNGLYRALRRYAEDETYHLQCSQGARAQSEAMSWRNTVADVYELIASRVPISVEDRREEDRGA